MSETTMNLLDEAGRAEIATLKAQRDEAVEALRDAFEYVRQIAEPSEVLRITNVLAKLNPTKP